MLISQTCHAHLNFTLILQDIELKKNAIFFYIAFDIIKHQGILKLFLY